MKKNNKRCKSCGSDSTKLQIGGNFNVYECEKCGLVFTDVKVDDNYYKLYYPKGYYEPLSKAGNIATRAFIRWWEALELFRRLKIIKKFSPSGTRLLEIGCGRGEFLAKLPDYFEKYGVEINKDGSSYIRGRCLGVVVYDKPIDNKFFQGRKYYDVIVMWHVFEHISDPDSFLKVLKTLLDKNGALIMDVPNRDSLGFRLAKNFWFHLDTPRHLFFFNHITLDRLLRRHGLQVISYGADPIGYFHDLSVSLCAKFKRGNFVVFPIALLVRFVVSLFWPGVAEINTYVITHSVEK